MSIGAAPRWAWRHRGAPQARRRAARVLAGVPRALRCSACTRLSSSARRSGFQYRTDGDSMPVVPIVTKSGHIMRPEASIAAVQFKAECLSLLDRLARTRRPLVMTKRGKPVAQLVPMPLAPALFGALAGSVLGEGDFVSGIGEAWDADR